MFYTAVTTGNFYLNRGEDSASGSEVFKTKQTVTTKKNVNVKITKLSNTLFSNSHFLSAPNGWVAKGQMMRSV